MALATDEYIPERDDPYRRGTPAYYARLQAILDAPIQGIAPGIGSFSTVGEPARPTAPKRRRFSPLADQDDAELGAAPVRPRRFSPAADEDDPYERGTPAYYARLQAMLDAPIQGIAPGIGSLSPEGRPALPTWVQQRLDEQERAEAAREAAAAKRAADLGAVRQPEPRRRLFDMLANQDDAELGAAPGRPRRFSPAADEDDPFERGTPAYYARLQAMLDAPIQGIAPGYGSFSTVGEPARRTEPERRPFSLLADQDDAELGAAREPAPAPTQEPREPEPRRPRQFSPLADQDDAEFGAARVRPRSFSPVADQDDAELGAARARRRRQPFSLLADQDDAEFGAASNQTSGPGAWSFQLTEGEEVTLTPSLEGYIPERLIEYHQRVQRGGTDPIGAVLSSQYSQDANQRAWWIEHYEKPGPNQNLARAHALRAGAPLTEYSGTAPQGLGDAVRWGVETAKAISDAYHQFTGEAAFRDYEAEQAVTEVAVDAIFAGLEMMGEEGADALRRFEAELAEWPELSRQEQFERLHQAFLGGVVSWKPMKSLNPLGPFDPIGALEGLAGREYQGRDHFLLRQLPNDLRDPLGELVEDATQPEILVPVMMSVVGGVAVATLTVPVGVAVAATVAAVAVSVGVGLLIGDLRKDDPASLRILEALLERANQMLDDIDPDGAIRRLLSSPVTGSPGAERGGSGS